LAAWLHGSIGQRAAVYESRLPAEGLDGRPFTVAALGDLRSPLPLCRSRLFAVTGAAATGDLPAAHQGELPARTDNGGLERDAPPGPSTGEREVVSSRWARGRWIGR